MTDDQAKTETLRIMDEAVNHALLKAFTKEGLVIETEAMDMLGVSRFFSRITYPSHALSLWTNPPVVGQEADYD